MSLDHCGLCHMSLLVLPMKNMNRCFWPPIMTRSCCHISRLIDRTRFRLRPGKLHSWKTASVRGLTSEISARQLIHFAKIGTTWLRMPTETAVGNHITDHSCYSMFCPKFRVFWDTCWRGLTQKRICIPSWHDMARKIRIIPLMI